jgi:hypothetical protein
MEWQNAKLPAGEYTFEIQSLSLPATMTVKGPNGSVFVTAVVVDQKARKQSMLIVENRGSSSAVSELRLANIGRSLHYATPKAPKDVELAQVTRERILVALNVKRSPKCHPRQNPSASLSRGSRCFSCSLF